MARLLTSLALLAHAAASDAAMPEPSLISHVSLLLPPTVTVELSAQPGCFKWVSERPEVATVTDESCEGGVSTVKLHTHAAGDGAPALVTALPVTSTGAEDESRAPTDPCLVSVAQLHALHVSTKTKHMIANELQWLDLSATDEDGNDFSKLGVRALKFAWSFAPEGFVTLIPPSETMQVLKPELASLSDAEAREFYRVPVKAVAAASADEEIVVRASLVSSGQPRRGTPAAATATLHVSPPLLLSPAERVAIAPGAALQYALWKRREGRESTPPFAVPPEQATARQRYKWSAAPADVVAVAEGGLALGVAPGAAVVNATQSLDRASAELVVASPHALAFELDGAAGGTAPGDERLLREGNTYYAALRLYGTPGAAAAGGSEAGEALPLLLPDATGELVIAATRPLSQLRPSLALGHVTLAEGTRGVGLSMREAEPSRCGGTCVVQRCNASTARSWCGGGGNERARHAPQLLPRCLCAQLQAVSPSTGTLDAALDAADGAAAAEDGEGGASWAALAAQLRLRVLGKLAVLPPSLALPWRCAKAAATAAARADATFATSGGTGDALAWASSATAVATVDGAAGVATPRAAGDATITATDARARDGASAALRLREVAALRLAPHAAEHQVDAPLMLTVLFAGRGDGGGGGAALSFDRCASLDLAYSVRGAAADGGGGDVVAAVGAKRPPPPALLSCEPRCASDASVSCVSLSLRAVAPGAASVAFRLDDGCGAPLTVEAKLTVLAPPPPQPLRLCVAPADVAAEAVVFRGVPRGMQQAALRAASGGGGGEASFVMGIAQPELLRLWPDEAAEAAEGGEAGGGGQLRLRASCSAPHAQDVRLTYLAAPGAEPWHLELGVVCGAPPTVDGAPSDGSPLVLPLGGDRTLNVSGAWVGAPLRAHVLPLDEPPALATLATAAAGPAAAAGTAAWAVALHGVQVGDGTLRLAVPGAATCAPQDAPLRVDFGAFAIACPSASLPVGRAMRCYALVMAGDELLPPSPQQLLLARFSWVGRGGVRLAAARLPTTTGGGGGGAPGESFSVLVTAEAAGEATIELEASAGRAAPTRAQTTLRVFASPLDGVSPPIRAAAPPQPVLLPPGADVALGDATGLGGGAPPVSLSLCGGAPPASGVSIDEAGVLHAGARAAGPLCVSAREAADDAPAERLLLEVVEIAQLRLLRAGGGGAVDFDGALAEAAPTRVCAAAYDRHGRPLLPAALPTVQLNASMLGCAAPAPVPLPLLPRGGPCFELAPAPQWRCADAAAGGGGGGALQGAMLHGVFDGALRPLAAAALLPLSSAAAARASGWRSSEQPTGASAGEAPNGSATFWFAETVDELASHSSSLLASSILLAVGIGVVMALQAQHAQASGVAQLGGVDPRVNPELRSAGRSGHLSPRYASPAAAGI